MSEYCDIKTQFKSLPALLSALQETGGWSQEQIQVYAEPQHLVGHGGDARQQTAHVIIRREHVGYASNDLGFIRGADGTYTAIISEYDSHRYGPQWQGRLRQNYAFHALRLQQQARGRTVTRRSLPNGKIIVEVGGYR